MHPDVRHDLVARRLIACPPRSRFDGAHARTEPADTPAENHPRGNAIVRRSRSPDLLLFGLSMGSGHQACDHIELASSNQRRVASSVQPGTAKRAPGAVKPRLGRTMTCRGLE